MSVEQTLSPEQRWQYKISFSLKLSRSYGTEFQDFFSTIMEKAHSADFIRVRSFGSLGDKGCDGYLQSCGRVFQCYGKMPDASVNVSTLVSKINDDFELARHHLKDVMREWHFGHNLVNGFPTEAVLAIENIKTTNANHTIGLVGPAKLEEYALALSPDELRELLGPAATSQDSQNLNMAEVGVLIGDVMSAIDAGPNNAQDVKPVPVDKLKLNKLPEHWCGVIRAGIQNAPYVAGFLNQHHDPEVGMKIAAAFDQRYRTLRLEGLEPGTIMDHLYEAITGVGSVTLQRQVAAHALLAHLFESCDIFERESAEASQ
jgi:hypothetical protein